MHGILTSISGMANALRRNEVAAHNIANVQTDGFRALRALSAEVKGGGVEIVEISEAPSSNPIMLPNDGVHFLPPSNVNLTTEITNQLINANAFKANINALKAQDELLGEILDIAD